MAKNTAEIKQVELNIRELKGFTKHFVENNRFLQAKGKMPVAVNVVGTHGIGKTSALIQTAQELGIDLVKLNLAQLEELSDLVGFPVRQFQMVLKEAPKVEEKPTAAAPILKKKIMQKRTITEMVNQEVTVMEEQEVDDFTITTVKKQVLKEGKFVTADVEVKTPAKVMKEVPVQKMMDVPVEREIEEEIEVDDVPEPIVAKTIGEPVWVDEPAVSQYNREGYSFTGQKRMAYCPPEWIAGKEGGGILLLDDFTRADQRFTQATMELIDRQQYISWKLPKDWHIVLSSNPDNGDYFVTSLDPAQKTRFVSTYLKYDHEIWAEWAEKEELDSRCITFMLMHPELVKGDINPRSITTFFNSISSLDDFEKPESLALLQMIGEGSVGTEFATVFTSFIANKLDKMLTPKDILLHQNEAYIIGELRTLIGAGKGQSYRADIASVLCSRIQNYSLHYAENNPITDKEIARLERLLTDDNLFTNDLQYNMVKKLLNGNKQKFQKLMNHQSVMQMAMK